MSKAKKLKTNTSTRPYQAEWFDKYGVIEWNNMVVCVICNAKVTSRTYNVKRHFDTIHSNFAISTGEERKAFFLQMREENYSQSSVLKSLLAPTRINHITAASFQVAYCIGRLGKSLSEGEFVKQALLECGPALFADFKENDMIVQRINDLPLSSNTIRNRVIELEQDISSQIYNDLNRAKMYSLALDESNDINGYAQLAVFGRYKSENVMKEELIKLISLDGKDEGYDIFKEFHNAFKDIVLQKLVSVTTGGAPNMVEFIQYLKQNIQHPLIEFHCIINQKVSCAQHGLETFSSLMSIVIQIINVLKARAQNKQQFAQFLEEVECQYAGLLTHNNVRWLNFSHILNHFVLLLEDIKLFLIEEDNNVDALSNIDWLSDLMFLCDITQHLNELNQKLQKLGHIVLTVFENMKIFMTKLDVFSKDLEMKTFKYFPRLQLHFQNAVRFENLQSDDVQQNSINNYLLVIQEIKQAFDVRFAQFQHLEHTFYFILYPYKTEFAEMDLTEFMWLGIDDLEMELVEFRSSVVWRRKFEDLISEVEGRLAESNANNIESIVNIENIILQVWESLPIKFTSMKKLANALLTMFGSTYSCEKLFSSTNSLKSSSGNGHGVELSTKYIQLMNTKYEPDIIKLSQIKPEPMSD